LTNKTSNSSLQSEKTSTAKVQKLFDEVSPEEDSKTPEVSPLNVTTVENNNETTDSASETEALLKTILPEQPQNLQVLKSPLKVGLNLADSLARSPAAKIAKQLEQHPYLVSNVSSNEVFHVTEKSSNENAVADNEQAMNLKVYRNEEQRPFDYNSPSKKVKRNLFASDDEFLSKNTPPANFHVFEESDKPQDLSLSSKNLSDTSLKVPKIYQNLLENQLSLSYKNQAATKDDQGKKNRKESGFCSDNFETSSTVSKSPDNLSGDAFVPAVEQQQVGINPAEADIPNNMTKLDILLLAAGQIEDTPAPEVVTPQQGDRDVVSTLNDVPAADKRLQVEQQKNTGSEECLNLSNQSSGSTNNLAVNSAQPQHSTMLATGGNTQQVYNQPPMQQQGQIFYQAQQIQQVVNGQVVTFPAFVPFRMNGSQMQPVPMAQFHQMGPPNGTQMPALPMGQFPMAMMPGQLLQPQVAGQSFMGQMNMGGSEQLNSPPPVGQVPIGSPPLVGQVPIGSPQPMHNVQQMSLNQNYAAVIQNQIARSLFNNYQPGSNITHNNNFNGSLNVSNNSGLQNSPANQNTQITNAADSTNNVSQAVRDDLATMEEAKLLVDFKGK